MSDEIIVDENCIPTKELLKLKRKQEYLKQKAQNKKERDAEKQRKHEEKLKARDERDAALLRELKPATTLDP